MSQSQDTIPELIVDDDGVSNASNTPAKENDQSAASNRAANSDSVMIANQGATATAPAAPAPQKQPKKRTYTKRGGASVSKEKRKRSRMMTRWVCD